MKFARRRMKTAPTIPFIALADIAWQIVIFFIVCAAFIKNDSLNVDLPAAMPANAKGSTVTVTAGEGFLQVNDKPVAMDALESRLRDLLKGKDKAEDRVVVVMGRNDLSFQHHVDILYAVQKAGGTVMMAEEN